MTKDWVDQNKCWSDWYQGYWPECEESEDFFEALCVFLETCNTYLDECYDDDWDGGNGGNWLRISAKVMVRQLRKVTQVF